MGGIKADAVHATRGLQTPQLQLIIKVVDRIIGRIGKVSKLRQTRVPCRFHLTRVTALTSWEGQVTIWLKPSS